MKYISWGLKLIKKLIAGEKFDETMAELLFSMHTRGPIRMSDMEMLAIAKHFQPELFKKYERTLSFLLGNFFKSNSPNGLIEKAYRVYAEMIQQEKGEFFSPVQADALTRILSTRIFSFSAPTNAGKSFMFRHLISNLDGDAIIILPSRALIAEYVALVKECVPADVLVMEFADDINKSKINRRVFILTPERCNSIFRILGHLDPKLFLFDEAQLSEDESRGLLFDSIVRRVLKNAPTAKIVFAHPFVQNPDAQLKKHEIRVDSDSTNYAQHSVGKMYIQKSGDKFEVFSPFSEPRGIIKLPNDFLVESLGRNKSLLIYTSKAKLYKEDFEEEFLHLTSECEKLSDPRALALIEMLRDYIGANQKSASKHSDLISLMEIGVVIHHGSMPLKARIIVERFIREGFCRICFATSTLIQGINMPFDVVFIDNFSFSGTEEMKILDLKNLIGRAGRNTQTVNAFDYGVVVINSKNQRTFTSRINMLPALEEASKLEQDFSTIDDDEKDLVEAVLEDDFNHELLITNKQAERIESSDISEKLEWLASSLLNPDGSPKGREYYKIPDSDRRKVKHIFAEIYGVHLRREELTPIEKSILSTAIPIMIWKFGGRSFKEIIALRMDYITRATERREIFRKMQSGHISRRQAKELIDAIVLKSTQVAVPLPKKDAKKAFLFKLGAALKDFRYDLLVYDTYDYMDKVISQSLTDPICAVFALEYEKTNDSRFDSLSKLFRYGSNKESEIMLLRYGFDFEEILQLEPAIESVSEDAIIFNDGFDSLPEEIKSKSAPFR